MSALRIAGLERLIALGSRAGPIRRSATPAASAEKIV
jgi:hypothetical protein